MSRFNTRGALAFAALLGAASAAHAIDFTVDPAANWLGYMNVSELPANGGFFLWGSPWGTADLTATWAGSVLTLGPNTIGDPNPYWYTPAGGPGAEGNKIMEANMYIEPAGSLPGQTVNFSGTVTANSLTSEHVAIAFIKDFAPDYSSFVSTTVALAPGNFSLTLNTINDPARHVQYGFTMTGKNVWVTDVAPFGSVSVTANSPGLLGDFDNDGDLDALDIDDLFNATNGTVPPANGLYDVNADGSVNTTVGVAGSDADHWVKVLKSSEYGDSNLDRTVNFDDLLTLAQNYGVTGDPSWSVGNFNGDGAVNFDDLLTLAQNYNFGATLVDGNQLSEAGGSAFMADLALARSMVPEPTSLGALAVLTMATRRRRQA